MPLRSQSGCFGKHNVAKEMLATTTPSATRSKLVEWLRARHEGVEALAKAWGIELGSWEDLTKRAFPDLPERGAA